MYRGAALPVLDLATIVEQPGRTATGERPPGQIVVMTLPNDTRFGLLVDDLGEIVEVLAGRLAPLPPMMVQQEAFADTAMTYDDTDDSSLLVVLRAERLYENLSVPGGRMTSPGPGAGVNGKHAAPATMPLARSA